MFTKGDRVEILHNDEVVATGTIVKKHPVIDSWWVVTHDVSRRNVQLSEKTLRKIDTKE